MAGSVTDGIMASKAVEVGWRDLQLCESKFWEILNSYKVSSMAGLQEMKKPDFRRRYSTKAAKVFTGNWYSQQQDHEVMAQYKQEYLGSYVGREQKAKEMEVQGRV